MYNTKNNPAANTFNALFYRTYSRRVGDDNKRESWQEAITRSFNGVADIGDFTEQEREMIFIHMIDAKTLPSGRWMWIGGTPWIEDPKNFGGAYNCFQGDTEVVTREYGNVKIIDIVDLAVHVLNKEGQWAPTKFTEYGEQELLQVTLRRRTRTGATSLVTNVLATADHNWHTSDGLVIKTKNLSGSVLPNVIAPKPDDTTLSYRAGLVHGMVYGDGSIVGSQFLYSSHKIRLCSEKRELLPFFDGRRTLYCPSYNGDPLVFIDGDEFFAGYGVEDLKKLPITVSDPSYLLGFFRGILATDGSVCCGKNNRITAEIIGLPDTCEFLMKISSIIGIQGYIRQRIYNKGDVTNYGARKQEGSAFCIRPVTLTESDTLRKLHRDKLNEGIVATDLGWNVLSVEETDIIEKVYCCVEPLTHTFTLADGILTGNCSSIDFDDIRCFGLMMRMAMEGSGTGAVLEPKYIDQLPEVRTKLNIKVVGMFDWGDRNKITQFTETESGIKVMIGDSRQGWADTVDYLVELAMRPEGGEINVTVDYSNVRAKGAKLKGFGGVANPSALPGLFPRMQEILNGALGRKLNSVEICLLIDECSKVVVAGNVRRSAGMRQGASDDAAFAVAKDNLWEQDEAGNWRIDPARDALRMANHTRVFHQKPGLATVRESVKKQYFSGEGAIQYAPEAIIRSNVDVLNTLDKREAFALAYNRSPDYAANYLLQLVPDMDLAEIDHRLSRYGLNPCGEIIGSDFYCNLSEIHLNQLDPWDFSAQQDAFKVGGLLAAALLNHKFPNQRQQYSREIDPIVGVSFTGAFDFFVSMLGVEWLRWWEQGRSPQYYNAEYAVKLLNKFDASYRDQIYDIILRDDKESFTLGELFHAIERLLLEMWKDAATESVQDYCLEHGLKAPNRCTTVQPAGSKSLLTGSSPGWHPPKGSHYIRRITFPARDPLAETLRLRGYSILPGQSDKDDTGTLLNDPFDPRCTEWLVEIPVELPWGVMDGADAIDINKFSARAQFDFYMQVQTYYTAHNTSATIEIREHEIPEVAQLIYQAMGDGYISATLLSRSDAPFPRMPFEVIDRATYQKLAAEVVERAEITDDDILEVLHRLDNPNVELAGPAQCDSDRCLVSK